MEFFFRCLFPLSLALSCARAPLTEKNDVLRPLPYARIPEWREDIPLEPLIEGLGKQIHLLKKKSHPPFRFGQEVIDRVTYAKSLEFLLTLLRQEGEAALRWERIKKHFSFYEVYGENQWGEVFLTAYYGPVIQGRKKPTPPYQTPLYYLPKDLVEIRFEHEGIYPKRTYGRLTPSQKANPPSVVVPYYSREEIDGEKRILRGRNLECCFVKPEDAFFLHIQGHGTVLFPDGTSTVLNYSGKNGHPYWAIGREFLDKIPAKEMSLAKIKAHLKTLSPEKRQQIFNKNPNYVFFHRAPKEVAGMTAMRLPAVAGRTIATDEEFFPKGTVGLLVFERPFFPREDTGPPTWKSVSRLVLDQDIGGAIRGPGRVDLFWGKGLLAEKHAGIIRRKAQLFYLAPRPELVQQLSEKP